MSGKLGGEAFQGQNPVAGETIVVYEDEIQEAVREYIAKRRNVKVSQVTVGKVGRYGWEGGEMSPAIPVEVTFY